MKRILQYQLMKFWLAKALISKNTSSSGVFLKGLKNKPIFMIIDIFKNINKQSIENFRKNKEYLLVINL